MKNLLIILVLLFVAFVSVGLFLPAEVHVERSVAINRPPATVFTLLNSYRHFNEWSPWADLDPDAEFMHSGPESGPGARLSWRGDPALIGTGWQEITMSRPNERVEIDLDFGSQGVARAWFDIRGDQLGSLVTWSFDTDLTEGVGFWGGLAGRYFGLFFDRWIGQDYEKGLADLKRFAESLPAGDFSQADIALVQAEPVPVLQLSGEAASEPEAVAAALADAYGRIMAVVQRENLTLDGQPMAITRSWEGERYRFEAAIPVSLPPQMNLEGPVQPGHSPSGKAVRIVHVGPYDRTNESYALASAYLAAHGLKTSGVSWEHYISDPGDTPPEDIVTHIYFLLESGTTP